MKLKKKQIINHDAFAIIVIFFEIINKIVFNYGELIQVKLIKFEAF